MTESEKKTADAVSKKRPKKTARKGSAKAKAPEQSTQDLNRDQLEYLREKLQKKYH
jgi:hypothetical protein